MIRNLGTTITEQQDIQCKLFAEKSAPTSFHEYEKRSQKDKKKIIIDIYNGKKAEFLVYNFLISNKQKLNPPDLKIYPKYDKSYGADLYLYKNNVNIHVKSHEVNENFPVSWLFQKNDPLLLKGKANDYLALVVMNGDINYMHFKCISEVVFKKPIKEKLKKTKACVYESDFLKNFNGVV